MSGYAGGDAGCSAPGYGSAMSSTAWRYFVPYQPDFQRALDELRAQAFERGAYLQPWTDRAIQPPAAPPESIDEAVRRCGAQGTHSILDIAAFSLVPGPGLACLVGEAERRRIYGTDQPGRDDVDDHRFALVHHLEEGEARLLVVWSGGAPSQLYFEGLTGS